MEGVGGGGEGGCGRGGEGIFFYFDRGFSVFPFDRLPIRHPEPFLATDQEAIDFPTFLRLLGCAAQKADLKRLVKGVEGAGPWAPVSWSRLFFLLLLFSRLP